jgi:hypothetical protein
MYNKNRVDYAKGKERQSERGATVLEAVMWMLIALVVAGAVFWGVSKAFGSFKLYRQQNDLTVIKVQIQQLYSGSPSYNGLDNTVGINAGLFPSDMVKGTSVVNRWGGAITLGTASSDAQFTISLTGVPKEQCTTLAQFGDDWAAVTVNGGALTLGAGRVSSATTACTGDTNSIVYTGN